MSTTLKWKILNLKAESVDKNVVIAGKGGRSVFGNDTLLEKCECNVLKKPYGKSELEKLIKKYLNEKHPDSISEEIVSAHEKYVHNKLSTDLKDLENKYKDLLDGITVEKGYREDSCF